jgi:hypothetical protein
MRDKFESTAQIKMNSVRLSLRAYYWGKKLDINDQVCDSRYRFRNDALVVTNFKPKMVLGVVMDSKFKYFIEAIEKRHWTVVA